MNTNNSQKKNSITTNKSEENAVIQVIYFEITYKFNKKRTKIFDFIFIIRN